MEITSRIYLTKDSQGNRAYAVAEDGSNTVQICGMSNKEGEKVYFESEAYHIDSFCRENSIELKVINRVEDFDTLWNE
jgi:hypothetical protein